MAATRALQASRWSLGTVYGLGALLLIFGVPTWVRWLVLGLFLAVAAVTFLTHWLASQQGRRSSAQLKDAWVEEWRAIWSRSVG